MEKWRNEGGKKRLVVAPSQTMVYVSACACQKEIERKREGKYQKSRPPKSSFSGKRGTLYLSTQGSDVLRGTERCRESKRKHTNKVLRNIDYSATRTRTILFAISFCKLDLQTK
jgi:hypothetical protein